MNDIPPNSMDNGQPDVPPRRGAGALRWVFAVIAVGGLVLLVLRLMEPGGTGIPLAVGTILFGAVTFITLTVLSRKGRSK